MLSAGPITRLPISGQKFAGQDLWLTNCQGITEVISGQNVPGQESKTYQLSIQKANSQSVDRLLQGKNPWLTDCWSITESKQVMRDRLLQDRKPWLTDCQGITESKQVISGQIVAGQESMTYFLLRHHKKQTVDQWTECCRTGIYDLPTVKASQKANRWSVDRMSQDRNSWLTDCQGIT